MAANGQEAIEKLEKQKADLILLDWEMPIMNGAGFFKEEGSPCRPPADSRTCPICAVSIEPSAALLKASFLQKPIDYARLLSTMKSRLGEQQ